MEAVLNTGEKKLFEILQEKLSSAGDIIFCVSFIKDSGIDLLYNYLNLALKNNANVSILTSTYLNVTEPVALYKLQSLKKHNLSLSIFDYDKLPKSFHIKGYYFKFLDNKEQMIIGSSNISRSALTDALEWNIILDNPDVIADFMQQYSDILENYSFTPSDEWLHNYLTNYRPSKLENTQYKTLQDSDETSNPVTYDKNPLPQKLQTKDTYAPIKCQIPALYELNRTREEGFDKALVIMATGLGKTFLSAFDSKNFSKILFVAHREEILLQAKSTFEKIRPKSTFGFFNSNNKDTEKDIIFASISTLGKIQYHSDKYFSQDYFDYIIVDEFHHTAAPSYLNFLDYFQPKFLLGLTATPDRLDNKDIYQHCDYNIAFECNFKTAINNGWLVPFSYYAIYDEIDYSNIPWRSGKYDLQALENAFLVKKRSDNIIDNYKKKAGKHTLAFCCSIKHANYTAGQFQKSNINAQALHSDSSNRSEIIENFSTGKISVLCVVDIFNEGVDIPHIDTVMFLRPTESFTIFIQQLGRGLRTNPGKDKLTVIDLVGNYKNSHLKLSYLTGLTPQDINHKTNTSLTVEKTLEKLPIGCSIDLTPQLINLFNSMREEKLPLKDKLIAKYNQICDQLNNKYSLCEFNSASDIPGRIYLSTFGSWLEFLSVIYPDNSAFITIKNSCLLDFLKELEKTAMTKLYKIPTILAFIQNKTLLPNTTLENITTSFISFYKSSINAKDFTDKNNADYLDWEKQDWANLAEKNPIHFLSNNPNSFFSYNSDVKILSLKLQENDINVLDMYNKELAFFVQDILHYRREAYVERRRYRE